MGGGPIPAVSRLFDVVVKVKRMAGKNPLSNLISDLPSPLERVEDYLDRWARLSPSAPAAIENDAPVTYRVLAGMVERMAAALVAAGIGGGDCVAVLAPPSVDFLVSFLATLKAGATWLGINPKYTRHEMAHVMHDSSPKLVLARRVIAERDYVDDLEALARDQNGATCRLFWLDETDHDAAWAELAATARETTGVRTPSPVAARVYTSGSTGAPKAAQLPHAALIRAALVRLRAWPVAPLRLINNVPINHVGGLGDLACTALVGGGAQVFLEKFSAIATLDAIQRHRVTYWYQAPTMFEMCLSVPEADDIDWSNLQAAIWSGGRPSDALISRLARVSPRLGMDYSMTESVGPITMTGLWDSRLPHDGSVGWPDPCRGLRIADAAQGAAGEVQIKDGYMFAGYYGAAVTADAFTPDGWFKTGDMASEGTDGRWHLVGRSKEMFKSGGYNVYPREIELALEAHPDVASAVVVEIPDSLYGEVGIAFVVTRGGAVASDALKTHCRTRLANYKVPKRIEIVDDLPMLAIGKVDKIALRRRAAAS